MESQTRAPVEITGEETSGSTEGEEELKASISTEVSGRSSEVVWRGETSSSVNEGRDLDWRLTRLEALLTMVAAGRANLRRRKQEANIMLEREIVGDQVQEMMECYKTCSMFNKPPRAGG
jgi:hypothetical protein